MNILIFERFRLQRGGHPSRHADFRNEGKESITGGGFQVPKEERRKGITGWTGGKEEVTGWKVTQ